MPCGAMAFTFKFSKDLRTIASAEMCENSYPVGRAKKWAVLGMKKIVRTGRHVGYKKSPHIFLVYATCERLIRWGRYCKMG